VGGHFQCNGNATNGNPPNKDLAWHPAGINFRPDGSGMVPVRLTDGASPESVVAERSEFRPKVLIKGLKTFADPAANHCPHSEPAARVVLNGLQLSHFTV